MEYKKQVLFVWNDEGEKYLREVEENPFGSEVIVCKASLFLADPKDFLEGVDHVVVAADLTVIKQVIKLTETWDFSLAFLPLDAQKQLVKLLSLSSKTEQNIEIALRDDAKEFADCG